MRFHDETQRDYDAINFLLLRFFVTLLFFISYSQHSVLLRKQPVEVLKNFTIGNEISVRNVFFFVRFYFSGFSSNFCLLLKCWKQNCWKNVDGNKNGKASSKWWDFEVNQWPILRSFTCWNNWTQPGNSPSLTLHKKKLSPSYWVDEQIL